MGLTPLFSFSVRVGNFDASSSMKRLTSGYLGNFQLQYSKVTEMNLCLFASACESSVQQPLHSLVRVGSPIDFSSRAHSPHNKVSEKPRTSHDALDTTAIWQRNTRKAAATAQLLLCASFLITLAG
eukprot:CAMPEP_0175146598 /NCGR_PEP_ID=MMETSP0087-20121206/15469_1 /TAXON_ID=136419 /ORGANISM="Unknown Unknown, Strain D1" /LENGTH=125 /DNA_ID=CAMNT_0016431581 /DNA_START=139 /DNA_END=513 /DNA_ORIENTATION=-